MIQGKGSGKRKEKTETEMEMELGMEVPEMEYGTERISELNQNQVISSDRPIYCMQNNTVYS